MKMEVLPGYTINEPSSEQIKDALQQVYKGIVDIVILTADNENQIYIQVTCGELIEYKKDDTGFMYRMDAVTLAICTELFLDYANHGSSWKNQPWNRFAFSKNKMGFENPDPKSIPAQPKPILSGKKVVLGTILGAIFTCMACMILSVIFGYLDTEQDMRLISEAAFTIVWLSIAGIGWAILRLIILWEKNFLYLIAGGLFLLTIVELWLVIDALGIFSVAFFASLLANTFLMSIIYKKHGLMTEFEENSLEAAAGEITFLSNVISSEFGPDEKPVLNYTYLEKYSGTIDLTNKKSDAYKAALSNQQLKVIIRYLPRDPKIHKVRLEILE